jgi:hypothetical protein
MNKYENLLPKQRYNSRRLAWSIKMESSSVANEPEGATSAAWRAENGEALELAPS